MPPTRRPAAPWETRPFYLHAYSKAESEAVTSNPRVREKPLGTTHNGELIETPPSGIHVALIDGVALRSLTFCELLQRLVRRTDVVLVPIFLDQALRMPTAEIDILRYWHERLNATAANTSEWTRLERVLRGFGRMVEELRATLAPSLDVVLKA